MSGSNQYVLNATCPAGHPFDGDNLYVDGRGHRGCRICRRAAKLRHRERNRRDPRPRWVQEFVDDGAQVLRVPLSRGRGFALIDRGDLTLVTSYTWQLDVHGYVKTDQRVAGVRHKLYMHRLIANVGDDVEVDHRNRTRHDNRRSNLRPATRTQQSANQRLHSRNRTGYRGVSRIARNGMYYASIRIDKRTRNLGSYATAIEAARAYDRAALQTHGEFANLNLPSVAA